MLGWYDYRLHRGIERYAQEHGWHLSEDLVREKVIPWGWDGHGILAWLGAGDDLASFVVRSDKPTVDFSFRRPQLPFARVLEDTTMTGQMVADHFLQRGFTRLMYYSDADNWVYEERGRAFVQALKAAGRECVWIKWHQSPVYCQGRLEWKRKRAWLTREIKNTPKPVAVFCASDGLALDLLESCESAGLAVPEQVAIVGAGNSLLAVDAMRIPISSVDPNMEVLAYRGAALLDGMMNGKPQPAQPVRVPPAGLIARKSSDLVAVNNEAIARSLRFLLDHCNELIGVDDLAKVANMSRRSFHEAFLKHIGRPPGSELQRVRLERAKQLILGTEDKIEVIAEKCGYQSGNSLWVAFKQTTGMSPGEFKRRCSVKAEAADRALDSR